MNDFEKITDEYVVIAQDAEVFEVVRWSTREIMLPAVTDFYDAWNAAYALSHLAAESDQNKVDGG